MAASDLELMMRQNGRMTPMSVDQLMQMLGKSSPTAAPTPKLPGMGAPFTPAANDPNIAAADALSNAPLSGGGDSASWINQIKNAATSGAPAGLASGGPVMPPPMMPGAGQPPLPMPQGGPQPPMPMPPQGAPPDAGQPPFMKPSPLDQEGDIVHTGGLIKSSTDGRADAIKMKVPDGSYMVPAHVVAALGNGNTLSGAKVLDSIVADAKKAVGMHEDQQPAQGQPPAPAGIAAAPAAGGFARGGATQSGLPAVNDMPFKNANTQFSQPPQMSATPTKFGLGQPNRMVPINASGGEYLVDPAGVSAIGGGDINHGHDILDMTIRRIARRNIAKLNNIPPPKKR